jgi:hypothetical protein
MPPNTVVVSRPTIYGNPFVVGLIRRFWWVVWEGDWPAPSGFQPTWCSNKHEAHEVAVRYYRAWFTHPNQVERFEQARRQLIGRNLACWCPLDLPCHADVLLELVNEV